MNDITKLTQATGSSLLPSDDELKASASNRGFVPGIKLLQGTNTEIAKEGNAAGDFYLSTDELNLSSRLFILVFSRRSHALLLKNREKLKESFIFTSPVYKEILGTRTDNANGIVSMNGFGDWLLWLPQYEKFVAYFCGKPSSRDISEDIADCMKPPDDRKTEIAKSKPHTPLFELFSKFETEKFGPDKKCFVPQVTPLDPTSKASSNLSLPSPETIETMVNLFQAPVLTEQQMDITPIPVGEDDR